MTTHNYSDTPTTAQFVIRRTVSGGIVVGADHPILGTIYWNYTDNSDCNAADHYGLTTNVESATRMQKDWRADDCHRLRLFLSQVDGYDYVFDESDEDPDNWVAVLVLFDVLRDLAEKASQSNDEFLDWWKKAEWSDRPAPDKTYYLEDINGFLGYKPQWTESPTQAMRLSQYTLNNWDNEEPHKLASLGEVIPVSQTLGDNQVAL